MAKLTFIFGAMGSAKTAQALMKRYNYIENGMSVLLLKPSIDTRGEINSVISRAGNLKADAIVFYKRDNLLKKFLNKIVDSNCLIVDEVQFATPKHIEDLKTISEKLNIPVFAYGLRTDAFTNMFPGSKRLLELADDVVSLESFCHCGAPAIVNARFNEDGIVYKGKQIEIGGSDKYRGLCYDCYKRGKLN